jgi:multidrug efflux system membrane fusion protein
VADKATAEWKLSKTDVNAPADGWINNLTVRIGDTATVSIANIGIVDAHAWRIIANYKEYYIRPFAIGGTAWVWLDSAPWKLHKARITGIARGFSRDPQAPMLLPYVAPTTDWIRLQRRIPVTIVLEEPPPGGKLYMGADARAVVFPR